MNVAEVFKSIQCEGILTGRVSVFIRLAGCNLNCYWCDEKQSNNIEQSNEISILELLQTVSKYNCNDIVITGGEPLIAKDIVELTKILKENNYTIIVETNGTVIKDIKADLVSLSPKLGNSEPTPFIAKYLYHRNNRINIEALQYYNENYNCQLKFVVENDSDFEEIESILEKSEISDMRSVLIMPLASTRDQLLKAQSKIVSQCIKYGYRFTTRLQLLIWGEGNENKIYK